jgi:hypothetical protein
VERTQHHLREIGGSVEFAEFDPGICRTPVDALQVGLT